MSTPIPFENQIENIIAIALEEDAGHGDITSLVLIPSDIQGKAGILVKEAGVIAGADVAQYIFCKVDPSLQFYLIIKDGTPVKTGDIVATISGNLRSILIAERTVLNFMQRLSGIASTTARYVAEVKGLKVSIVDTRKTTPGLRLLEKYAVRMGGGKNHRFNLSDMVLIKDNHISALRAMGMSFKEIVAKARRDTPQGIGIEAEATSVEEAMEAVEGGADIVMLDNMSIKDMRRAVKQLAGRVRVEASGGVTLANVKDVAETGVDLISIGALTHSVKSLDISLEVEAQTFKMV